MAPRAVVSRHACRASSTHKAIDAHAVAMAVDVLGDRVAGAQRGGQHKANLALLQHVGGAVALAGFRPGVGHQRHAKGGAIEIGRLARISYEEFDVIGAAEGKEVASDPLVRRWPGTWDEVEAERGKSFITSPLMWRKARLQGSASS